MGPWHARAPGFDLHAGIVIPAGARDRLERWCRYSLRPPVGQDRLQLTPDGKAVLELQLVALIRDPAVIQRILRHLRLPEHPPVMRPSRAPPLPFDDGD